MKKKKGGPERVPYEPREHADVIEIELARLGLPLTRANWLAMEYPFEPPPDPFPAELEAQMPRSIQTKQFRGD